MMEMRTIIFEEDNALVGRVESKLLMGGGVDGVLEGVGHVGLCADWVEHAETELNLRERMRRK